MSLMTEARPSWREEARQNKALNAQLDREKAEVEARIKRENDANAARIKRENDDAADRRRERARLARSKAWADRRRALSDWVGSHVIDLLFVPVIGLPTLLAASGMAPYGASIYPVLGWGLPVVSEGLMWAFEIAVTLVRRQDAKRMAEDPAAEPTPVWKYLTGVVVFAVFGAVLNFMHGLSVSGVLTGIVMALVSVAPVTAHNLIKAPRPRRRRTRAERDDARIARIIRKRETAARAKAARKAEVAVETDGRARLLWPDAGALAPAEADVIREEIAGTAEDISASVRADTDALRADMDVLKADTAALGEGIDALRADIAALSAPDTTAAAVRDLRARNPRMSQKAIAEELGIDPRTVRRHLAAATQKTPEAA